MLSRSRGTLETILVVDDNEAVLHVVAAALESADFRVLVADSPAAALRLAKKKDEKIDLLLSDVEMPDMSGPQLAERTRHTRPQTPVLLMSGYTAGALPSGPAASGDLPLIRKPFNAETLLQHLQDALT